MAENNKNTISEYTPDAEKQKRRNNFVPRICALLLAVIMWFYVMRVDSPTYEKEFDYIPIELTGAEELLNSSGFSVISGYDGVVSVTLSGKQRDINRLKTGDITASVDLSSISLSGEHHLPVSITAKSGIKVIGYEPTALEVYVDTTLQRDIEVVPKISYNKEENLVLGEPSAEPALIKVSGPATIINSIKNAVAEADFGKITKSMNGTGTIKLYDAAGNVVTNPFIKTNVSSVNVRIPAYKQKYLKPVVRFTDDSIPAEYFNVSFSTETVKVQGEAEYIDSLGDSIVVLAVDPRQIKEKSSYEILLENIDENLEYPEADAIGVQISLDSSVKVNKRTIPVYMDEASFVITGLAPYASYEILTPQVLYIELRSINSDALDGITAQDIKLRADLSTVSGSGEYNRGVVVEVDDPEIYTSEKYTVTFNVNYGK